MQNDKMAGRDVQRRTRRSASAIQGAAQDTAVGRLTRLRAGARPANSAPLWMNALPSTTSYERADTFSVAKQLRKGLQSSRIRLSLSV